MGRKAKDSTTMWRRRYIVTHFPRLRQFRVMLVRGRVRRTPDGCFRVLVAPSRGAKFAPYVLGDPCGTTMEKMFELGEHGEMLTHIAVLRLQGYTPYAEVPSW